MDIDKCIKNLRLLEKDSLLLSESEFYSKYANIVLAYINPKIVNEKLYMYRSRLGSSIGINESIYEAKTFSYIPREICTNSFPSRKRFNKTGQPIFYASASPATNYQEIDMNARPGEIVYVSKWEIEKNSNFSIFNVIAEENISESVDLNTHIGINKSWFIQSPACDYFKYMSHLMLKKECEKKSKYILSSFLANKIYSFNSSLENDGDKQVTYDALSYNSIRKEDKSAINVNFAIKPDFIDKHARLVYVIKGNVKEDLQSFSVSQIGFCKDGIITWHELRISSENTNIEIIGLGNANEIFPLENSIIKNAEGNIFNKEKLEKYLNSNIYKINYKDQLFFQAFKQGLLGITTTYNSVNEKADLEEKYSPIRGMIELDGWTVEHKGQIYPVKSLYFDFQISNVCVPIK